MVKDCPFCCTLILAVFIGPSVRVSISTPVHSEHGAELPFGIREKPKVLPAAWKCITTTKLILSQGFQAKTAITCHTLHTPASCTMAVLMLLIE